VAYTFEQIFAADPANPANVAQNASILIYAPGDVTKTPLTINDPSGGALSNPVIVNANGFGSAFMHATLDRVAWDGGGFTGFFTSYEGMKNVAVAAQTAAEAAAATAGTDAAAVATAAIGDATADADAAAASAATAANNAAVSATAAANSAALVGAPADTAIAAALNGSGATKAALTEALSDDRGVTAAGGPLTIPTYDGNLNAGHPSVVEIPAGFGGYRYWMAFTPYPAAGRENPSVVASHNGIDWEVPAGLTNPVTGVAEIQAAGYNYGSDTHLIYTQSKLWMYYRIAHNAPTKNAIYLKTSTNGVTWSTAVKVAEDLALETSMNSPCVEVEADGSFTMWCANYTVSPPVMTRRTSADGLTWSAPANCVLPTGAYLWHMDVKRVGATYYCLFNSAEVQQGDRLYYFTSTDGITWTGDVKIPAVETDGGTFPLERFYRSVFIPRVGTPLRWDVYPTLIGTVGGAETWRIGLIRDTPLPTVKQTAAGITLAQDRTDALYGIGRWIAGDSFARADNATTLGNTATGQAWAVLAGTPGITGRTAYSAVGGSRVYIDTGQADVEIGVDVDAVQEAWILFRATDDANWLRAGVDNTTGRFAIEKRVANTITRLWTGGSTAGSDMQVRKGDRMRVVVKGNVINLYRNTRLVKTWTESFNNTATKHGLSLASASRVKAFGVGTP
jgi:hypothetical protein